MKPRIRKYIIGVDEAGRGPLAGPVMVGAVMIPRAFRFPKRKLADSKQLSAKRREEWFAYISDHPEVLYATASVSSSVVDRIGIRKATLLGVRRTLEKLSSTWKPDVQVEVLLDGLLYAPEEYRQQTIIRGDETIPVISLASIVAKVTRDRMMVSFAKQYPQYGFEKHKGYGTKEHYERIGAYGICGLHRKSFL